MYCPSKCLILGLVMCHFRIYMAIAVAVPFTVRTFIMHNLQDYLWHAVVRKVSLRVFPSVKICYQCYIHDYQHYLHKLEWGILKTTLATTIKLVTEVEHDKYLSKDIKWLLAFWMHLLDGLAQMFTKTKTTSPVALGFLPRWSGSHSDQRWGFCLLCNFVMHLWILKYLGKTVHCTKTIHGMHTLYLKEQGHIESQDCVHSVTM